MKIVKNLSVKNIREFEDFIRREDLDFIENGKRYKAFSYKGIPITTLREDIITYLCIRVDCLENEFTYKEWMKYKEWMQSEEYKLCDKFNGVFEFDIDELVEIIENIVKKIYH